ncbi:hypothetical protein DY000_02054582 [Brassica cretica]|uniref:Uncharacterized protein n=1 Tax=Brassica cretica TaxID=69181 RepID=A0ABQ7AJA8_BRACR|nr:hypothetical protein DY000_02054582 [Brassica cretica]
MTSIRFIRYPSLKLSQHVATLGDGCLVEDGCLGSSRQQRGNSVVAASAPARGPDGGCIGDLESTHHEAMMDTVDLSRSQRLLVAYATRLAREGSENVVVGDATECARDGQIGHPKSPVYPEDFLKSVRAVALLRIYRWSEITVEKIRELKDRIARREWRSDLPNFLFAPSD